MSGTEPNKASNRRSRTAKREPEPIEDTMVGEDKSMADKEQNAASGTSQAEATSPANGRSETSALSLKEKKESKGEIEVRSSGQPRKGGEIEVAELFSEAGLRPIAASHLQIYGTILNNRPIMASNIKVWEANALADHRPIFASDIIIRDDLTLPGGRPIIASDPRLLEASLLPGGRPIAPNDTEDSDTLMGYID